jgi:glycosyltransferase involved in cell wall biosynthesis
LEAAALICRDAPNARFLIIGRGNMEERLKADIQRLDLTAKARLTGQMRDMPQIMNAVDCLVHPQIGTEALGLVVCEAHACGRPVIASALDGIPEAFAPGGCGKLVPAEDIRALAEAMLAQSNSPAPDAVQRAAMHQRVEQFFSLRRQGDLVLQLYRRLTDK